MQPTEKHGYFVADTRLLSRYDISLSGTPPVLVDSAPAEAFSARFEFQNRELDTACGTVPERSLHLRLDRVIGRGVHEDYDLVNYGDGRVEFDLEIRLESDFVDLLDVRDSHFVRRGLLAAGCLAYGFAKEGWAITRALFDAAQHFEQARLPEVFAGVARQPGTFPSRCLGACAPQAWAAGAVFHALASMLGLHPDAHRRRLVVAAQVPDWLDGMSIRGLRVGSARIDLSVVDRQARLDTAPGEIDVVCS